MPTIAFLTLGCKLNYAETSTYERAFKAAGWEVVSPKSAAAYYLVNTCSVTATSDAKSRNLIRKVHRLNPEARIVVTGCSAQLRRADIERIDGVFRVFGSAEKAFVVPETLSSQKSAAASDKVPFPELPATPINSPELSTAAFAAYSTGERTRSFLKVQDGCCNYCAYCTVPYARGESRNVPVCECVKNAEAIAAQGVKEIVLTGVNTGDFGRTTGESFLDLLKALHSVEGIERYRISSIEPNLLTQEIIDWIASEGYKFQPHFHIPLQTGCDVLLKKMGRRYDTEFFAAKLESIRKAMERPGKPEVFFGIDVMVGLPGETDALFGQTVDFLKSIRPAFIHVFPYSRRPGTPASEMPGQVEEKVKAERVARLEALCASLHEDFASRSRGKTLPVLFESKDKEGMMSGYTSNYIRVSRPYDPKLVGKITEVEL